MADRVLVLGPERGGRLLGYYLDPHDAVDREEIRRAHDPAWWPTAEAELPSIYGVTTTPRQVPDFVEVDLSHPDALADYVARVAAAEREPEAVVWERLEQLRAAGLWPQQWRTSEWLLP